MPDKFAAVRGEENMRQRDAAVRRQHAAAITARRRSGLARNVALVALSIGCGWLTYSNGVLAQKLAGKDVVYAALQANGEFVTSTHYSEVPPAATQEQDVQNALWTYVQARDCYGSTSMVRQFYIAQAMSDFAVGKQVKEQFALINPLAPQHVYGDHGLTVQCELVDPPTPIGDRANNQYLFRFRRWEQGPRSLPEDAAVAPFYTVSVRFRTGIYPDDDPRRAWLDRTTFNSPGVQVIDYPGAKPTSAQPGPRPNAQAAR